MRRLDRSHLLVDDERCRTAPRPESLVAALLRRRAEIREQLPLLQHAIEQAQQDLQDARCAYQSISLWIREACIELRRGSRQEQGACV